MNGIFFHFIFNLIGDRINTIVTRNHFSVQTSQKRWPKREETEKKAEKHTK